MWPSSSRVRGFDPWEDDWRTGWMRETKLMYSSCQIFALIFGSTWASKGRMSTIILYPEVVPWTGGG